MRQKRNASGGREIKSLNTKRGATRPVRPTGSKKVSRPSSSRVGIKKPPLRGSVAKTKHNVIEKKFMILGIVLGIVIITVAVGIVLFIMLDQNKQPKSEVVEVSAKATSEATTQPESTADIVEYADVFSVEFLEPQINGTSQVIVCAKLLSKHQIDDKYIVKVLDGQEVISEENAVFFKEKIYAKAVGLSSEKTYDVVVLKNHNEQIEQAEQVFQFSTPKRCVSISEIEDLLEDACGRTVGALSKDNQILYETQAVMQLLGMDVPVYGRLETFTQTNQVMIDYSLNSYGDFVFWNNINEAPTKESIALLKDIMSVDKNIKKSDLVKPFTISAYSMTDYAKYDHHGGQISSEDYVFDAMRSDQNGQAYFVEYPYVVDTPEFQTKYADLINGKLTEGSDELKELKKEFHKDTFKLSGDELYESIAAKNKVFFANYCSRWLEEVAVLEEKRIYLYSESGRYSKDSLLAPTMVSFSYMYEEYRELTGLELTVNNSYRSCEVQWDKYTRENGKEYAMARSGDWHLERQIVSYVPGYSNHQFAVAIDFQPAQSVFIESEAYKYLEANANKYGFYNYALEPWHWTYLGVAIDDSIIESTQLAEPLMDE